MRCIMPGLFIKDIPAEVQQKLKARAAQNRRSMTKEALPLDPPVPLQGKIWLNDEWIDQAKREGRA